VVPSTVEAALMAVTSQVPGSARVRLVSVRSHPSDDVVNVTTPVPPPPSLSSRTVAPASTSVVEFDTVKGSGVTVTRNVKVTVELVSSSYETS